MTHYVMSDGKRLRPAWVFSVASYVEEELEARNWTKRDLADRMGGEYDVTRAALDFLELEDPRILLGEDMAAQLERAFGVSAQFWLNVDQAWREADDDQRDHTPAQAVT